MEGAAQAEETGNRGDARFPVSEPHIDGIAVDVCYKFSHRKVAHSLYGYGVIKAGIVDAWFGEILRSPLLQWGKKNVNVYLIHASLASLISALLI